MKYIKPISAQTLFLYLSSMLALLMLCIVSVVPKSISFEAINCFHTDWMDKLFIVLTNLGDGLFALVLVGILVCLKRYPVSLKLLATFLLSGIVAQLLKALFHAPRPKTFFTSGIYHHFIQGVTHGGLNSFPSGHSATAFAVASILTFHTGCKKCCILFFSLGCLVIYSRIYLGQHFLEDTFAGMIIGICSSVLVEHVGNAYFVFRRPGSAFLPSPESFPVEL